MSNVETVHVVFKTHLDIGFTDLAAQVVNRYMHEFIPGAMETAKQLAASGGPAKFVWTTGSWLIHEYLKRANDAQRRQMEEAIARGWLVWHGLPFTTHTELMDSELFRYGLSISKRLDRQFGKTTIAAKMTDVPGHTRAIVRHMADSGIRYLHLGVNAASKVPCVPEVFVWRGNDGSELIVNYADNYGNMLALDGMKDVLVFAHTSDNCGPPSAADIEREFARLAERFPGAEIRASTMDAFAAKLLEIRHDLPVVREEIGDSWIHGTGSDPVKVAQYRALLRLRSQWLKEGRLTADSEECMMFSDQLLMIPEHTWGMDEKKHLADYTNYAKADFQAARKADVVPDDAVPAKYAYLGHFQMDETDTLSERLFTAHSAVERSYRSFERSWQEQRAYMAQAIEAVGDDKQAEVVKALAELEPRMDVPADAQPLDAGVPCRLGCFSAAFGEDGSIVRLVDPRGKRWADDRHRIGAVLYESFGVENYDAWFEQYLENRDKTYQWSDADYAKPGMELVKPIPRHRKYSPRMTELSVVNGDKTDRVFVRAVMPEEAVQSFGAPARFLLEYEFDRQEAVLQVTLQWSGKQASRLPEATWFSFALLVDNPNLWLMDKLGERISPLEVCKNGNRNLHGVHTGLYYDGADGRAVLETLDAPLVSPGAPRLLQFDNTFASMDGGFHFQLHNNVWGTNFPMWFEEDAKFRFRIRLQS